MTASSRRERSRGHDHPSAEPKFRAYSRRILENEIADRLRSAGRGPVGVELADDEIGSMLGIGSNGARMRVARALGDLSALVGRNGNPTAPRPPA